MTAYSTTEAAYARATAHQSTYRPRRSSSQNTPKPDQLEVPLAAASCRARATWEWQLLTTRSWFFCSKAELAWKMAARSRGPSTSRGTVLRTRPKAKSLTLTV